MTERVCENCRWWDAGPNRLRPNYGHCHRRPPADESFPSTHKSNFCGEWSDKTITPEQEDRQKLTRQFALAIMSTEYSGDLGYYRIWTAAKLMVDEESRRQREDSK